ncbi:MAG: SDH family Clp fold serine proteinase [Thermoleophilia bacterium]
MATPANANAYIIQQLGIRAEELEAIFSADLVAFDSPILGGVDDYFRSVIEDIKGKNSGRDKLVVFLTTPGGYIEVVHRIVDTLRHHYGFVDFVIPNYAYSAGTVLALSGDAIHMNYYSRLGPIDPQVETDNNRSCSALGYLIKWDELLKKARDGSITAAEIHLMLDGFDQAELYHFEQARALSITLLKEWLAEYKFKNWDKTETRGKRVTNAMRKARAAGIAKKLNNTNRWHSHGYGISMDVLRKDLKLLIDDFDSDLDTGQKIKDYYALLDDFMKKLGNKGILHSTIGYLPFM